MQIPIIVLNWNGLEDTLECVDALLGQTHAELKVLLIDNGSDGDDYQRLAQRYASQERVEVRCNPTNLGFTGGMNKALSALIYAEQPPECVALLNNDAIPEPGWLEALLDTVRATDAAVVASCMINYWQPDQLDNAGHVFLNTSEVLPRGNTQPPERFTERCEVVGACAGAALYRTEMLREIGLFDDFFETGYEDAELGLRVLVAGYRQIYQPAARVHHKISRSIDKVRDFDYAVKLQVNINYSYFKLMPWPLIVLNTPFLLLKLIGVMATAALFLRRRLLAVQVEALRRTWAHRGKIREARAEVCELRRGSSWRVLRQQRFFLWTYLGYFRRYILARRRTVFER